MSISVDIAKPEEREGVLAWVRAQAGHEDYSFLNWSDVLVVRDADGTIRAVSEMAAIQTAEFVFDVGRKARDTWRTWQAVKAWYDANKISPVFIMPENSRLAPFVPRILRKAFVGFQFFRR